MTIFVCNFTEFRFSTKNSTFFTLKFIYLARIQYVAFKLVLFIFSRLTCLLDRKLFVGWLAKILVFVSLANIKAKYQQNLLTLQKSYPNKTERYHVKLEEE